MRTPLHALALAAVLLLAGCTTASSAAQHAADHPAAPHAGSAPHHAHDDALPEAAPVYAPSGVPAGHASHSAHEGNHAHASHGDAEGCQMGCCEDGACGMACCQKDDEHTSGHATHDHAAHGHGSRGDGEGCQMACCQEGGSCDHEGHAAKGHANHAAHVDLSRPAAHSHRAPSDPVDLPAGVERVLHEALAAYLAVSDRLAGDSMEGVAEQGRALEAAAAQLAEAPALGEHAEHLATVRHQAAHLARAATLPDARDAFGELSPAFAHLVAAAGAPEGMEVTRFVCGMAGAPEGGVWLQQGDEPRNPYFGAAMLRCHRGQEAL